MNDFEKIHNAALVEEAARLLLSLAHTCPEVQENPYWRWPLIDELSGVASAIEGFRPRPKPDIAAAMEDDEWENDQL